MAVALARSYRDRSHLDLDRMAHDSHLGALLADLERSNRRAYWDGVDAALGGIELRQNPHPEYSSGAGFWQAGYLAQTGREAASPAPGAAFVDRLRSADLDLDEATRSGTSQLDSTSSPQTSSPP